MKKKRFRMVLKSESRNDVESPYGVEVLEMGELLEQKNMGKKGMEFTKTFLAFFLRIRCEIQL